MDIGSVKRWFLWFYRREKNKEQIKLEITTQNPIVIL